MTNRFSFSESDGRSGTLDPLPEGKLALNTNYKPVYSEWKPTFDKTDVVGAMEAIAGWFSICHFKPTSVKESLRLSVH